MRNGHKYYSSNLSRVAGTGVIGEINTRMRDFVRVSDTRLELRDYPKCTCSLRGLTYENCVGRLSVSIRQHESHCVCIGTSTLWFKRFMKGCHRRMEDVWCLDRPLTMGEALVCQEMLEDDCRTFEKDPVGRLKTVLTGLMIVAGLGSGMRGEEIV
jgi:hypothetical protein